jgi:diguanylate cyclase (GGDEF)-like protein/PAS domain S-box-containing protein
MGPFVEPATIPVVATDARAAAGNNAPGERLTAPVWLLFNAVCALFVIVPAWNTQSPALLLGWLTCVSLNLVGTCYGLRWLAPGDSATWSPGLAAVLGLVWGIGTAVIAAGLALPAALVVLLGGVAAIGATVPLIANSAAGWLTLLGGFFGPTLWLLAARDPGLAAVWAGAVLPLLAIFARRQQLLAAHEAMLSNGVAGLHRDAALHGLAVPVDARDPQASRGRLAALQQALDETVHAMTTLAAVPEGLLRIDRDGRITYLNGAAETLTGVRLGAALGQPVQGVLKLAAPGCDKLTAEMIEQCFASGLLQRSPALASLRRHDGFVYGIECVVSAVRDADRRIDGLVFLIRDVTARREEAQLLNWRATHDSLTALATRTTFEEQIARLLANDDAPRRHTLCVIDLDDFTGLDEQLGMPAGDRMLREIATVLRAGVRNPDLLARSGEDEFAVLLYDCALDKAVLAADELRAAIEQHRVAWSGAEVATRASIGLVEIGRGVSAAAALALAKQACVHAKRAGGNRLRVSQRSTTDSAPRADVGGVERAVRDALGQRTCRPALLPALPLDAQALQPSYGELVLQLPPDADRRPVTIRAHQSPPRLAVRLDRELTRAALEALRRADPALASRDIIAVDVSAASLVDAAFTTFVLEGLAGAPPLAHRLCFEIAASLATDSLDRCANFVAAVRDAGCLVTLDGFGTGSHSFQLLKRLRPDFVKIDEEFVRRLGANSVDYEIVLGMSRVAKALQIKTIADGVSTPAARELLRRMGIDLMQGPLLAVPDHDDA